MYRTNCPPPTEPKPPIPFSEAHPNFTKIGIRVLGAIAIVLILLAATYGAFYFGLLIFKIINYDLVSLKDKRDDWFMMAWMIGFIAIAAISVILYFSGFIGDFLTDFISKKWGKR